MELSKSVSAVGLYAYHQGNPGETFYSQFYELVRTQLERLGIEPTYIGASTAISSGKLRKFGGRVHKTLLTTKFRDIVSLSIVANPLESNAPAFDKFFSAHVGYIDPFQETTLSYTINEAFLPLDTEAFREVLKELIELHFWNFGIGFSDSIDRSPELHISGGSNGRLSKEEAISLQAWYRTPPEIRVARLRSVYPYNIVNERQLSQKLQSGISLKELIEQERFGTLTRLSQENLYCWKMPDESQREALREFLKQQGIVIS